MYYFCLPPFFLHLPHSLFLVVLLILTDPMHTLCQPSSSREDGIHFFQVTPFNRHLCQRPLDLSGTTSLSSTWKFEFGESVGRVNEVECNSLFFLPWTLGHRHTRRQCEIERGPLNNAKLILQNEWHMFPNNLRAIFTRQSQLSLAKDGHIWFFRKEKDKDWYKWRMFISPKT